MDEASITSWNRVEADAIPPNGLYGPPASSHCWVDVAEAPHKVRRVYGTPRLPRVGEGPALEAAYNREAS
jgi:hypothetical protein